MSLRKVHIEKISHLIAHKTLELKSNLADTEKIANRVRVILTDNMEQERAIEDEAHKLLDKSRKMMGGEIDEQKAFMLIKKQLAKQRNFVL